MKGHVEEQNGFFHIKELVEDIFKTQFSTFSPIIHLSFEKKRHQLPAFQLSNFETTQR